MKADLPSAFLPKHAAIFKTDTFTTVASRTSTSMTARSASPFPTRRSISQRRRVRGSGTRHLSSIRLVAEPSCCSRGERDSSPPPPNGSIRRASIPQLPRHQHDRMDDHRGQRHDADPDVDQVGHPFRHEHFRIGSEAEPLPLRPDGAGYLVAIPILPSADRPDLKVQLRAVSSSGSRYRNRR